MTGLSSIFDNTPTGVDHSALAAEFDSTTPAEQLEPVPAGEYPARWVAAELDQSRLGKPLFLGRFEISTGLYTGRRFSYRWFLTPAALPYARRDLAALGLTSFAQLQCGALPKAPVRLRVVLRRDDSGHSFNEVRAVLPGSADPPSVAVLPPELPETNGSEEVVGIHELASSLVDTSLV